MAKRRSQSNDSDVLMTSAATLGNALGRLANRIDAWRGQRSEIARDLNSLISQAQGMLKEVGHEPSDGRIASLAEIAHAPIETRKGGRRKGSKISKSAREKNAAAQKLRWAKFKKSKAS